MDKQEFNNKVTICDNVMSMFEVGSLSEFISKNVNSAVCMGQSFALLENKSVAVLSWHSFDNNLIKEKFKDLSFDKVLDVIGYHIANIFIYSKENIKRNNDYIEPNLKYLELTSPSLENIIEQMNYIYTKALNNNIKLNVFIFDSLNLLLKKSIKTHDEIISILKKEAKKLGISLAFVEPEHIDNLSVDNIINIDERNNKELTTKWVIKNKENDIINNIYMQNGETKKDDLSEEINKLFSSYKKLLDYSQKIIIKIGENISLIKKEKIEYVRKEMDKIKKHIEQINNIDLGNINTENFNNIKNNIGKDIVNDYEKLKQIDKEIDELIEKTKK